MKTFSIYGRLQAEGVNNHQEMIIKLFQVLKENGFRFVGETKDITEKYITNNK